MPPDAAPVVASNDPILNIPAADQPGKPSGFQDRWRAAEKSIGAEPEDLGAAPQEEPKAAEPAKSETKAKEAPKTNGDATAGDRGMFNALAKKLGYIIDEKNVLPSERIQWENAKKRQEEGLNSREAKLKEAEASLGSNERVKKAESILSAIEAGDPDGFASAVGKKDFNEFQQEFIKRLADPNYVELNQLKKWRADEEKRKADEEKTAKERAAEQDRTQRRAAYLQDLGQRAAASSDKLAQEFADDPMFVQAIFAIQQDNWDDKLERTVSLEEALDGKRKNAKQTFREEMKGLYGKLHKVFGSEGAPAAATSDPAKPGRRPAPKTAVTPPHTVNGSGPPKPVSEMSPTEWAAYKRSKYADVDD